MTTSKALSERRLWIILAVLLFLVLLNSILTVFNVDEIEHIHSSWKILNTGHIYTDVFQNHHPLIYYIIAPVIAIVGENIATLFILRWLALLTLLCIIIVTYLISKELFDKKTAILSIILLASMRVFIHRAMEIRPDTPQVLFGLISILFLLSFYKKRSYRALLISSISLAISFMFLQKALLLILILGLIMTIDIFRRKFSIKDMLFYSFVFIISLIPLSLYLLSTGELEQYILLNWKLNLDMGNSFSPLSNIFNTLRRNTLIWVFYFAGLWLVLKKFKEEENRVRLAVFSILLLATIFLASHPSPQYFMHAAPLVSILSAFALTLIFTNNQSRLFALLIIGTLIPAFAIAKRPFKSPNSAQLKKLFYAQSIAGSDGRMHSPDRNLNLFREDIKYIWTHGPMGEWRIFKKDRVADSDYSERVCREIEKERPSLISDQILVTQCSYIKKNYKRSEKYEDILILVKDR